MLPVSDKSTPEHYGLRPNIGSRVAVIDIGSNSVRLVVYEKNGRYPTPLFDERSNCQLGAQLDDTGHLKQDRIDAALVTITPFFKETISMLPPPRSATKPSASGMFNVRPRAT